MKKLVIGDSYNFNFKFSENDQKLYRELSGDNNYLHFKEFKLKNKKQKPILYGLLLSSMYSKAIGNYIPGPGSIIMSANIRYHNYAYTNLEYSLKVNVLHISEGLGIIKLFSKITRDDELISSAEFEVTKAQ